MPGHPSITECPSSNCGPRRNGLTPRFVVIHYTAMDSAAAAITRLCDPAAEVSAHYLISNGGYITRMVAEDQRAWHAGQGSWLGLDDLNSRSIGIELDNRGTHPFAEPQMAALEHLLRGVMKRWSIPASGIIGHSDLAPGRKSDPGPHFDWARLARQGLAAQIRPVPFDMLTPDSLGKAAKHAGFTADVPFEVLLAALRLRCGPWRSGPLQPEDFQLPSP